MSPPATTSHVLARSPWVPINIHPATPGQRHKWLAAMRGREPSDPAEWISDYLPSLLAVHDASALPYLKDALYHPDNLVRQYTLNALALFDDSLISTWIPATIEANGPTVELAYMLSWRRDLFQSHGAAIIKAAMPYLKSPSPVLTAGALQTFYFLKPQYDWKANPDIPAQLDHAVAVEADRLIATRNPAILQPLALYLGMWRSETSRRLLERLVKDGTVREQAEICLRWISKPLR